MEKITETDVINGRGRGRSGLGLSPALKKRLIELFKTWGLTRAEMHFQYDGKIFINAGRCPGAFEQAQAELPFATVVRLSPPTGKVRPPLLEGSLIIIMDTRPRDHNGKVLPAHRFPRFDARRRYYLNYIAGKE